MPAPIKAAAIAEVKRLVSGADRAGPDARIQSAVSTIAILGAGELGAAIARRLADRDLAGRIVLVDPDEARARGKALDIRQAGPVAGSDTVVEGYGRLEGLDPRPDVVVVADPPDLADPRVPLRATDLIRRMQPALAKAFLVFAASDAAWLVEAAVAAGLPRRRVLGSAPLAFAAAFRHQLARELDVRVTDVTATVLGLPPEHLVLPQAAVGGLSVEGLWAGGPSRRVLRRLRGRPLGPVALAAAAAHVVTCLAGPRPATLTVLALLNGEYGCKGIALAVPARLGADGVESVLELALEPVDRVAFGNAVEARHAARA